MFSERRDTAAAKAFFRSAKTVTGITPDRITTDGHDSYPRAIRTELGKRVRHRTSPYMNNRIGQDHRGIKGRYRAMRGFQVPEIGGSVLPRSRRTAQLPPTPVPYNQHVPVDHRRLRLLRETMTVLTLGGGLTGPTIAWSQTLLVHER